ncbi:MAG: putative lactam utilization protein B-like protein [Herbinix sp.]|jgi:UPF0271 protein|nr:putative lactam utilization protein B-like protein [Herbinix sp.]
MFQIDINCDLGEGFGAYRLGADEQIIPYLSSANIACGYHASDPLVMMETVRLAKKHGVHIGAHPGFPDLMGFGRRSMLVSATEAKAYVLYQIGALYAFCKSQAVPLSHVKPHGALYNMAVKDAHLAQAICEAIREMDENLVLFAPVGSEMQKAAEKIGLKVYREVFADRAYEEDGSLTPRSMEGALITDSEVAIKRVIRMVKEGKVLARTGKDITIQADTVCIHGDGSHALTFAKQIYEALQKEGIQITR